MPSKDDFPVTGSLRGDFIHDAREELDNMLSSFREAEAESADPGTAYQSFLRSAHNLKGLGGCFGFHSISVISHLVEDRIRQLRPAEFGACAEVVAYIDRMTDIVESGVEPDESELRRILDNLTKATASPQDGPAGRRTVVIVAGSGTIGQLVRHGLEESGFRCVSYSDPYAAMSFIVRTRPDAVVCTAEIAGLSGFDLVHALVHMPATADIPVALLTNHDAGHPRVKALPRAASCVHVGPEMVDRLAAAFGREKVSA